ncbi:MAG: Uma2 family endonuclease [Deltaproteobacteria bacterium]|nr:Uma2 family endonuclease [Deltaproteobacteria bacterium]
MVAHARKAPTYEDILALPEHLVGEIVAGELVVMPRPAPRHASAATSLAGDLNGRFQHGRGGPGGWWILMEPELRLGIDRDYDTVVPDIAGWRRERLPELPETASFSLPPDWVCEVLSPATARLDRALKMPFYARARMGHLWLVDPLVRTLEAYRNVEGRWLVLGAWKDADVVRVEPFDAVEVALGPLWG